MRGRGLRWVVVGLVAVVGLYFALDFVTLRYLESRGATEVARAMTAEEAKVDLGSVPFLPGFFSGRLRSAEVNVKGASGAGGLRVQKVTARLRNMRYSWRDMLALSRSIFSTRTRVKMEEPFGLVEIGQSDLEEFVRRQVPVVRELRIDSSGITVRFGVERPSEDGEQAEELTEPARLLPRVQDRRLVLTLVGLSQVPEVFRSAARTLESVLDLPRIPEGLRTDVRLGVGVIIVEASGRDLELTVGEGES
jgi:hypothetical protein